MAEKETNYMKIASTLLPRLFDGNFNLMAEFLDAEPVNVETKWGDTDPKKFYRGVEYESYSGRQDENPYSGDIVTRYDYKGTWYPRKDLAERIEKEFGNSYVVDTIQKLAAMKANASNYQTTDEAMKKIKEFFAEELEKECNRQIKLFQDGKISKREFDAYVKKYNKAKEEYLPKIEENWAAQKDLRDKMPELIEKSEQERNNRAMLKANAKATFIKVVKSPLTFAKFIKQVLKSNKKLRQEKSEQRKLEREARDAMKRKEHIEKLIKSDDKTL